MSDISKNPDGENINADKKSGSVKKSASVRKKIRAKSDTTSEKKESVNKDADKTDSEKSEKKRNIIEKLKNMGVMSGEKTHSEDGRNAGVGEHKKAIIASLVSVLAISSLVWALSKDTLDKRVAAKSTQAYNHVTTQSNYADPQQSYYANQYNGNGSGYNPANQVNNRQSYGNEQYMHQMQEQQQKWIQQQQRAQEQQRLNYEKWIKQQQQAREQQRLQQQQWMQQQRAQQGQQQQWGQQSYDGYPSNFSGQGQPSAQQSYYYMPGYQPYYRR